MTPASGRRTASTPETRTRWGASPAASGASRPTAAPASYYWRAPGGVEWVRDDPAAWRWIAARHGRDRSRLPRDDRWPELRAAPNHYAAFPPALVRPLILGWSPERVCLACGGGRFPVTSWTGDEGRRPGGRDRYDRDLYSNLAEGR